MADTRLSEIPSPVECANDNVVIIKTVLEFLQLFLPITLAKRVVAIILLAAGILVARVTELTGLCNRSTINLS